MCGLDMTSARSCIVMLSGVNIDISASCEIDVLTQHRYYYNFDLLNTTFRSFATQVSIYLPDLVCKVYPNIVYHLPNPQISSTHSRTIKRFLPPNYLRSDGDRTAKTPHKPLDPSNLMPKLAVLHITYLFAK